MKIIKCSNDYICQISSEKIDNKSVLKIDFAIKQYEILIPGRSWVTMKYPKEVWPSIKDKLYVSKDSICDIIELLDIFLDTGNIVHPTVGSTNRGFAMIEMNDLFGNVISMQQSSSIDEKLWFGTKIDESLIGVVKEEQLIPYQYQQNQGINVKDRLHLKKEQAFQLRMAILREMSPTWTVHDIADLLDKNTPTTTNMIIDIWGELHENVQKTIFMYACAIGNLPLVKSIYQHPENKFLDGIFCTLEEYGIQMSMQPESKKILKFFKTMMEEKDMQLSHSMERWIRQNKLGRKIKLKN